VRGIEREGEREFVSVRNSDDADCSFQIGAIIKDIEKAD